ncbi:hypothetical protein SPB21_07120 [Leptothoe sp. ISB3NOV94-8A]
MNTLPKPHTCRTQQAQVARHDYLEVSRRVIGEPDIDYLQLYQRFIVNEWAAIKLDDSVALTVLIHTTSGSWRLLVIRMGWQTVNRDWPSRASHHGLSTASTP